MTAMDALMRRDAQGLVALVVLFAFVLGLTAITVWGVTRRRKAERVGSPIVLTVTADTGQFMAAMASATKAVKEFADLASEAFSRVPEEGSAGRVQTAWHMTSTGYRSVAVVLLSGRCTHGSTLDEGCRRCAEVGRDVL